MPLFKIDRELQFGVCSHREPRKSCNAREGEQVAERRRELGGFSKQKVRSFSLAASLPGRKEFFLLGSTIIAGLESSPFWSPNSI